MRGMEQGGGSVGGGGGSARRLLGHEHPDTLADLNNLALTYGK